MDQTETIADTGLIVGLLHRRDQHHDWAKQQFDRVTAPLYTCEAVLSEAFHLLEPVPTGQHRLLAVLDRGIFDLSFTYFEHADRIHTLMRTYADQPMSYADACLVRMAEVRPECAIVTTDVDFHVYRTAGDEPLDVRLPNS
jgi:predicted nucleic acid-binding protein